MSRRSTPKTSYQKLHADSGYLSGLVDKARRSDEAAAKRLFSSSSGRSRELVMNTFDDTEWDIIATGTKLVVINRRCDNLSKQVKKPTRFPIIPLECTLVRAREKAIMRRRRSTTSSDKVARQSHTDELALVDGCGRTRAALRKVVAVKHKTVQLSEGVDGVQQKSSTKRNRGQELNTRERRVRKAKEGR